jgi:hypothetical protein
MMHEGEHRRIALPPIPEEIPDTTHGCTAPPAQPPRKIHPEMLEHLDLLGRLERLELLERLANNRMKVSESGLVAREHLEDGHAPPSEEDQARWASAGAAGVVV